MTSYQLLPPQERETVPAPFDRISLQICEENAQVIVLTADLASYTDIFKLPTARPRQFLDVGMAEQNLMCVAGVSPKPVSFRSPPPSLCTQRAVHSTKW